MDGVDIKKYPPGVVFGPLSQRVFVAMAKYTAFPWPVLAAQCKRCQVEPTNLSPEALEKVLPFLVGGVARFTSPQKGELLKQELLALLTSDGSA